MDKIFLKEIVSKLILALCFLNINIPLSLADFGECTLKSDGNPKEWFDNLLKKYIQSERYMIEDELIDCREKYPEIRGCTSIFANYDGGHLKDNDENSYKEITESYIGIESLPRQIRDNDFLSDIKKIDLWDRESFKRLESKLNEINSKISKRDAQWEMVGFEATGIAGQVDDSKHEGRVLIHIPSAYFSALNQSGGTHAVRDLYVQMNIPHQPNDNSKPARLYSVVAVHNCPTKEESYKKCYYIIDHVREENSHGKINVIRNEHAKHPLKSGNDCFQCHINGPLKIKPLHPESTIEFPVGALNSINKSMLGLIQDPFLKTSEHLMPIGLTTKDVFSEEMMNQCVNSPSINREKIRNSMNCLNCHNSIGRAKLYYVKSTIFRKYIEDGSMPPNSQLSVEERSALIECLNKAEKMKTAEHAVSISCPTKLVHSECSGINPLPTTSQCESLHRDLNPVLKDMNSTDK